MKTKSTKKDQWFACWDSQFNWSISRNIQCTDDDRNWIGPFKSFRKAKLYLIDCISHDRDQIKDAMKEVRSLSNNEFTR